jgi:hypothetical protein
MSMVNPYKTQILQCDEDFFLNFEKNKLANGLTEDNMLTGMQIKQLWLAPETTDIQKAHIWGYFQKLIRAGEKVF